jgi:hypothetical protein
MDPNVIFYDENNNIIDNKNLEAEEQILVNKYIKSFYKVLELGARYGTVSHIINKKLYVKTNQVSVEPDSRVWNALDKNRKNYNSQYHIVKGFIANKKLDLVNKDAYYGGYGSTAVVNETSEIPSYSLSEIQKSYGIEFDALVADCEGYLEEFMDENPFLYDQLKIIIFEADYPDKCNYQKIQDTLSAYSFHCIEGGFQNVWIKFNPTIYKNINPDLSHMTVEEAIHHFYYYGRYENRLFYY